MTNNLTDKEYWSKNFGPLNFFKFNSTIPQDKYISKYLEYDEEKTCIEIGAYPGGNLGYFVKKFGFQPTALDFLDNAQFIVENMKYNGVDNCDLINHNFLIWQPEKLYDVVTSFGFVEHFHNYQDIIQKHIDILKPGGYLIISVPYFSFFQLYIRKLFYQEEHLNKILNVHNRRIMNLSELIKQVKYNNRVQLLFAGYIREMTIWFPKSATIIKTDMLKYYDRLKMLENFVSKLHYSSRFFSPEILLIGKKLQAVQIIE